MHAAAAGRQVEAAVVERHRRAGRAARQLQRPEVLQLAQVLPAANEIFKNLGGHAQFQHRLLPVMQDCLLPERGFSDKTPLSRRPRARPSKITSAEVLCVLWTMQ